MYGGLGCGKFYAGEVARIESWHRANLPPGTGYTPEQVQAGLDRLAAVFGFFHTLSYVEEVTPFKRTEILDWPVSQFKHQLRYLAWQAHFMKKYNDIMKLKK